MSPPPVPVPDQWEPPQGNYDVKAGDSLLRMLGLAPSGPDAHFHSMKYMSKPPVVDTTIPGSLTYTQGPSGKPILEATRYNAQMEPYYFHVHEQPPKYECVLIFDEETGEYTLEYLESQSMLRPNTAKTAKERHNRIAGNKPAASGSTSQHSLDSAVSKGSTPSPNTVSTGEEDPEEGELSTVTPPVVNTPTPPNHDYLTPTDAQTRRTASPLTRSISSPAPAARSPALMPILNNPPKKPPPTGHGLALPAAGLRQSVSTPEPSISVHGASTPGSFVPSLSLPPSTAAASPYPPPARSPAPYNAPSPLALEQAADSPNAIFDDDDDDDEDIMDEAIPISTVAPTYQYPNSVPYNGAANLASEDDDAADDSFDFLAVALGQSDGVEPEVMPQQDDDEEEEEDEEEEDEVYPPASVPQQYPPLSFHQQDYGYGYGVLPAVVPSLAAPVPVPPAVVPVPPMVVRPAAQVQPGKPMSLHRLAGGVGTGRDDEDSDSSDDSD